MLYSRVQRYQAQSIDDPTWLDRQHVPSPRVRELIVAGKQNSRLHAFYPKPKDFVVATQVQFRSKQLTLQAEPAWSFHRKRCAQGRKSRSPNRHRLRVQLLHALGVGIDRLYNLWQRRRANKRNRCEWSWWRSREIEKRATAKPWQRKHQKTSHFVTFQFSFLAELTSALRSLQAASANSSRANSS